MVIRGEVWLATLDPTVCSEIRKTRPCLIVSPPEIHDHLRTAIVAPMTTGALPNSGDLRGEEGFDLARPNQNARPGPFDQARRGRAS